LFSATLSKAETVPILAIAVTTIECDGHNGAVCPSNAVLEFPHPQSVSIRLAKQSGWTVWIETTCPECSLAQAAATVKAPVAPVMLTVEPAPSVAEHTSGWCARRESQLNRVAVGV
jgi:hypothetical protein